jgi:DNA polymerase III subunit alpha
MADFIHLHVHSQFSILDGACRIPELIEKAISDGMKGVALTDHGNLFGAKIFHEEAMKHKGFKPIIGCETYVARRSRHDKAEMIDRKGDHLILLAKNLQGYMNLMKLISLSWIEGHYYKPRIDKELLRMNHEGIIASSACLAGEIPRAILNDNPAKAEEAIYEYKEIFGDDFYLELMRHPTQDATRDRSVYQRQETVSKTLVDLARKTGVKLIATNDVHFLNNYDADAHDRLLCLNTGKDLDDPTRLRYTGQEWFKTRAEMEELFNDCPEVLENTMEIFDKVEIYKLNRNPVMPDFQLPEGFTDPNVFLRHITYEGAKKRYPEITGEIRERIDFELKTIEFMGFPGYFLIVQDFIQAARDMGVAVGPGRGSAAGSVVSFCTRITDIDPLKYDLLFERFLNPERISMPDIDIDFDEDGREKVMKYVVDKYGSDNVAQVITFGTMAAKMAIRDIARVQKLPLIEADRLAKLVPDRVGVTLKKAYAEVPELDEARKSANPLIVETLKYAETLEGSVRHTGLHACGVIIGKDKLIEWIPVTKTKDSDLLVTQFDGKHIESVGMLKMDFLGLKTLSIINDTIRNIKISKGIEVDIENISLDDDLTYQLFSLGKTTGIFQFESEGMQKYLKDLKPNRIEDLIAMNALYRPGPMDYIPKFINRKYGREKIIYDIPVMEKYLKDTYGITVYQEQVMLLSQELGGFSKGEADSLRKAMGKKIEHLMAELKPKFFAGCRSNGHNEQVVTKIWKDWEAFANYAFNKSHSTCYAYVAYRMAYLKAHFPAEFMSACLSRNMNDIKEITNFTEECKRMGIRVLRPDVNESDQQFMVNKNGEIRFGLAGLKNMGEQAALSIIRERGNNGPYNDITDFIKRIDLRSVNKRGMESLAKAGAFDSFSGTHRAQYFYKNNGEEEIFLEKILKFANDFQSKANALQHSLFGADEDVMTPTINLPSCAPWTKLEQLKHEKDVTGFYISGHPLDDYKLELENFCTLSISEIRSDIKSLKGKEFTFAGIITDAQHKVGKNGKPFGSFTVEDYFDSLPLTLFSEEYMRQRHLLVPGTYIHLKARVEPRFDSPDMLNVRVTAMGLLSEVSEKFAKSVTVTLSLENITSGMVARIRELTRLHIGNCRLIFHIRDEEERMTVEMPSRKIKVDVKEFTLALDRIEGIKYKIA